MGVVEESSLPKPTNAEIGILSVLWERGPSTVREVHEELARIRDIGYTTVLKLKVGRNFVTYDARELIVRFAMTNKISPLQGSTVVFLLATCKRQLFLLCPTETEDPCVKGQASCVPNSVCIVEKDTFRCVCSKG